jgi:hypothetical protein
MVRERLSCQDDVIPHASSLRGKDHPFRRHISHRKLSVELKIKITTSLSRWYIRLVAVDPAIDAAQSHRKDQSLGVVQVWMDLPGSCCGADGLSILCI